MTLEWIGLLIGAALSFSVLTYIIGDNRLYRLALHLFIGAVVGYAFGLVVREVFVGMALPNLLSRPLILVPPLVLGALLLFKGHREYAYVGNVALAYLIGVGAAVALGGTLLGTLGPQIVATTRALAPDSLQGLRLGLVDGLTIVVGTVSTLLTFTFIEPDAEGKWGGWGRTLHWVRWAGRVFLMLAVAVAFAGALTTSLSILIGRLQHFIDIYSRVAGG